MHTAALRMRVCGTHAGRLTYVMTLQTVRFEGRWYRTRRQTLYDGCIYIGMERNKVQSNEDIYKPTIAIVPKRVSLH